jgi:hypothetical protein
MCALPPLSGDQQTSGERTKMLRMTLREVHHGSRTVGLSRWTGSDAGATTQPYGARLNLSVLSTSSTPEDIFLLHPKGAPPARRAAHMDRPGRPQGDNDIVEQYNNPKELALPRALRRIASPVVDERLWPPAPGPRHKTSPRYTAPRPFRERTLRSLSSCLGPHVSVLMSRPPCHRGQINEHLLMIVPVSMDSFSRYKRTQSKAS